MVQPAREGRFTMVVFLDFPLGYGGGDGDAVS